MKTPFLARLLCILAVALAPWAGSAHAQAQEAAGSSAVSDNYKLNPGDLVEIKVFQEDDLLTTTRIAKDGTISFPLLGTVQIGGKTIPAAAARIRDLLDARFLVNPQVTITLQGFDKRRFTVLGQVQKPGTYSMLYQDSIDLLEAIGTAGGFTRIANQSNITLKRVVNGSEEIIKLNAKAMAKDRGKTVEVLPGDIITVGESVF